MSTRSNRRKRNTLKSQYVRYSQDRGSIYLEISDRTGNRTLKYTWRKSRNKWSTIRESVVRKLVKNSSHVKAPIAHPHTDPQSRVGRGGTGNMPRDYRSTSEVYSYSETEIRKQEFFITQEQMVAIVASYGYLL